MNLLESPEGSGYPTEYLIARIRGRRVHLVTNWKTILSSPNPPETLLPAYYRELINEYAKEGVWKRMLKEFKWVYTQMNGGMRIIFSPFFIYSEIKTIVLCLRYKISKETSTEVESLLAFSLLSKNFKEALQKEEDLPELIGEVERIIFPTGKTKVLKEVFLAEGFKGMEEKLTSDIIKEIIDSKLHPVFRKFFIFIIDIKNIITAYKHLRWGVETTPLFIQGGSISESTLEKTLQSNDVKGVARTIHQLFGVEVKELNASTVENTLFTGLTKEIKSLAIESPDVGFILDYLWKIYIEACNISILLYGGDIERENIRKDLVF